MPLSKSVDKNQFYQEVEQLVDEVEEILLKLEQGSAFYMPVYFKLCRAFNSVKGGASIIGQNELARHADHFVSLITRFKGHEQLPIPLIDYILRGCEYIRDFMTASVSVKFEYLSPEEVDQLSNVQQEANPDKSSIHRIQDLEDQGQNEKGKIFIIDDEREIVLYLKEDLQKLGFRCYGFDDSLIALKKIKEVNPDLIITDIKMPQLDGLELMDRVHKQYPFLPIVVSSAFVSKEIVMKFFQHGVTGLFEKPYKIKDIEPVIVAGVKKYRSWKLLNRSIDLLAYQFENFEDWFNKFENKDEQEVLKSELKELIRLKKELSHL